LLLLLGNLDSEGIYFLVDSLGDSLFHFFSVLLLDVQLESNVVLHELYFLRFSLIEDLKPQFRTQFYLSGNNFCGHALLELSDLVFDDLYT
jgi:hypothetical protein